MCVRGGRVPLGASFEVHLIRSDRASRECESEDCALFMSAHKGLDYSIGRAKESSKPVKNLYEQPLQKSCPYKYLVKGGF